MKNLHIKAKLYDYDVEFTDDFSKQISAYSEKTAFVIDQNVFKLYKEKILIPKERVFLMDAVEDKKNMDTVMDIIRYLKELGVRKDWTVVCVGGGITQDVTTVAADLFLRNVDWHLFPTTLLSMCDSCIGGKCGINLDSYKNQIGVFYPPKRIVIDTAFIDTLTPGDYLNGWGEILKFALTNGEEFFDKIVSEKSFIPCERIEEYIYDGLRVKQAVIEEDEYESDIRRILNYGHTFGHALEAYTHHVIPHGKGVIWGIDVVNYIGYKKGLISELYYLEIKDLIRRAFLLEEIVIDDARKLYEIIKTDKKVKNGSLSFAMLDARSHLIVYPIELNDELFNLFVEYLVTTHEYYSH
ncbi:MAG: hypothetical protein MJ105_03250 [Lachnospiraceae bacterium]|nr:hypothetical protein [Lachnospiraceae bacterium]